MELKAVADWVQVALNAGAILTGGVIWKMYFENLKATVGSKQAQVDLATAQANSWREKAEELESRSPEKVEQVLAARIAIREDEIAKLSLDREQGSVEISRLKQEVAILGRTRDQAKGFLKVLEMEQVDPTDPGYDEYVDYVKSRDQEVVDIEVVYMGSVGVDSGQLLITDPCYIDSEWLDEPYEDPRVYKDSETNALVRWGADFTRFDETLEPYGKSPSELIELGRWVQVPPPQLPDTFAYSYNAACQATTTKGFGELVYRLGHPGAGVVFGSGWGDGVYPVYGEKHDGRIVRVYVNAGADPVVLEQDGAIEASGASTDLT